LLKKFFIRNIEFKIILFFICVMTFFLNFNRFQGQDILIARQDFQSGKATDFQSSIASLFYGSLPDNLLMWWQYIIVFQILCTATGLYLIFDRKIDFIQKKYFYLISFFSYITINLSAAQTRDGILISVIFFSLGLVLRRPRSFFLFSAGVILYLFGFSFRPWLAVTFIPLFLIYFKYITNYTRIARILLSLSLALLPLTIDNMIQKYFDILPAFPQQTVMIHDLTSTYCLSPIESSRNLADKTLAILYSDNNASSRLCNFYKPNTWQSVIRTWHSTNDIKDNVGKEQNEIHPIMILEPGDDFRYKQLQSGWIDLLISNPKSYIQNHLIFFTQIILSGESPTFLLKYKFLEFQKLPSINNLSLVLLELYEFPVKLLIQLYFFSPFFTIFIFTLLAINKPSIILSKSILTLFSVFIFWIGVTTIGYISDNGRYTYLPILILYAGIIRNFGYKIIH